MNHIQGSYLTGYVTILVKGDKPELFFRECMDYGIIVWNVKKKSVDECQANIKLRDINIIKKINRTTHYKLSFIQKKGYPFIIQKFMKKKELLLAFLISLFLIVFLSNILWKVTITGVPQEMEEKINEKLINYGIHLGSWTFMLDTPSTIQQKLVNDLPELLWVGVQRKGTTLRLEGVEKTTVEKEIVPGPRNLIATKKGVIKKIYVTKGQPKKKVNDFVEAGDLLVSGVLNHVEESNSEEMNDSELELVAAEADITAQTWYEINVTIPLSVNQETLTGNQEKKYLLRLGKVQVPIWRFGSPDYEHIHQEMNENPIYLLKWKLPIHMVESILNEKVYNRIERTKEEAIEIGIIQAKHDLQMKLGPDAKILSEEVLQDTIENGKVKLLLYVTVEEDISKAESITQGD